jgi:hypothetical protein
MSIILKALRKVQHQNKRQQSGLSAPVRGKTGDASRNVSVESGSESRAGRRRDIAFAGKLPAQEGFGTPSASREGAERHRFGSIPKLLLAMMVAVGMFATGWFLNRIYSNFSLVAETSETTSPVDAGLEPPPDTTRAIVTQDRQVVPAALQPADSSPVETTSLTGTTAVPVSAPTPQVAQASGVESPPPPAAEPAERPPVSRGAATEPSVRGTPDRVEKEARPERPKLKINAIAWRLDEPKAIVNMQRIYVGDIVEGATVLAIRRKSVLFEFEGETFEVRF